MAQAQVRETTLSSSLIDQDMDAVNALILTHLKESHIPLIYDLACHLVQAGGKRIRPLLTLLTARLFGYEGPHHITLAGCIECIHTASLLHDDVVDNSEERRGKHTANRIWGNKSSILVGDFLFTKAFSLMVKGGNAPILQTMSKACEDLTKGEVRQLVESYGLHLTEDDYLQIITLKTATLFEAANRVGALIANAPSPSVEKMGQFGRLLGLIYQLKDDLLDYQKEIHHLGKKQGDDFHEGKVTLPVILSYQQSTVAEKAFWEKIFTAQQWEQGDFEKAQELIDKQGVVQTIQTRMQRYHTDAMAILDTLPQGSLTAQLSHLLCTASARTC